MNIKYQNTKLYKNNLFVTLQEASIEPIITLKNNKKNIYTLFMFDPNAVGGNKIHWLIINITDNEINNGNALIKYKGPAPPKGSGKHHYTFVLAEQKKIIEINNLIFETRFIELKDLFRKLEVNKKNFIPKIIKYFVSENI